MSDVVDYPSILPPPIDQNYGFEIPVVKQESDFLGGYTRMRERWGTPPPTYTMNFWFNSRQLSVFRYFWHKLLKSGTLPTKLPMLVPEDLTTITLREGRFRGNYTQPRVPAGEYDSWLVQCQFILNKDSIVSFEEYLNLYFGGDLRLFNIEMRNALREWPKLPEQDY